MKLKTNLQNRLDPRAQAIADERKNSFLETARTRRITNVDFDGLPEWRYIWTVSDFVWNSCIRHPEILQSLQNSGDLLRRYGRGVCHRNISEKLDQAENEEALMHILRLFRIREMVRIAWRDMAGLATLAQTLKDLTNLAESCLDGALDKLHAWLSRQWGYPTDPDGLPLRLIVIGMGKLGARELNFSSDIDLVFSFEQNGETRGGKEQRTNKEFFQLLARRLIHIIDTKTEDGLVFRVDARLRPYGENGPLAMSLESMESYYQCEGREWERYAWIKARPVAGDVAAGMRLLKSLEPFVYRRYLDFDAFDALRDMKRLIANEVKRKGMENNIKLGPGGIREVEFIGQTFQLLRGGREPEFRHQGILRILGVMEKGGLLPRSACVSLRRAYRFLRTAENRLQERGDQQTHEIPSSDEGKRWFALAMGYPNWENLQMDLSSHRTLVHNHFNALFHTDEKASNGRENNASLWLSWNGGLNTTEAEHIIRRAGFKDPARISQSINDLRRSPRLRGLSARGRERLERLVPLLVRTVGKTAQPEQTFNRIMHILETIARRSCYLALLLEYPSVLDHLARLVAASPRIADDISRHPLLLDELLDPRILFAPPDRRQLEQKAASFLPHLLGLDLETRMNELRDFHHAMTFRIIAADVSGALPLMKVSDHLTWLAEVSLDTALRLVWDDQRKDKKASPFVPGGLQDSGFTVIGYGKLGGRELAYGSDLDLVFLHTGAQTGDDGAGHAFFIRLCQRLLHFLTAHTSSGVLYKVDMRLRPGGESGVLLSSVESFSDYQRHQAWTWEHQALVRARPVAGDPKTGDDFLSLRRRVLSRRRDERRLRDDVSDMRNRLVATGRSLSPGAFDLKRDKGGIVDVEFLVQYLVLREAHRYPELLEWPGNVRLLEILADLSLITPDDATVLKDSYLAYRTEIHRKNLQDQPAIVAEIPFNHYRREVRRIWDTMMEGEKKSM